MRIYAEDELRDGAHALRVPLNEEGSQSRKLRAYALAGRASACFFETSRAWLTCRLSSTNGRHSSSVGDPAAWNSRRHRKSRLQTLIAQGLFHSVFFTLGFLCFPSIYAFFRIVPQVANDWAVCVARWIGLRSIIQIEQVLRLSLQSICGFFLFLTLLAFVATAVSDPGRVPRKYHWIVSAEKCSQVAPANNVPPSQRRLAIAQLLGLAVNDVAFFEMLHHSSSFSPFLHAEGAPLTNERPTEDSTQPELSRAKRKAKIYISHRAVRLWQSLVFSEERDSLWSIRNQLDLDSDVFLKEDSEVEVPTDLIGLCDGVRVRLKWCAVCQHVRLPRTRHCTSCQCCVDRFDHHCVWVCNCVGLRNHRYFLGFVVSASCLNSTILILCGSLYHELWGKTFHLVARESPFWIARISAFLHHHWILMKMIPGEATIMVITFLLFFPLVNLILFHAVLVASNRTTTEEMRELYLVKNPFDLGFRNNIRSLIWGPSPPSIMDRWGHPKKLDGLLPLGRNVILSTEEHGVYRHARAPRGSWVDREDC
eukprot:Gregarina_sp_Poly_1__3300@NODE_1949_length_3013_cov_46_155804_g1255_i0_p1_GENE_NODE_1949_length_3013_cov_46_155804_g1255_i0NODE_1949_length_3013_cov_46_155804_g1255_i0_p1_ORF_typecomplete_len537_score34_92DHHC/PF01529_20/5_1e02DHHC/PF01529_20/3_2e29_NODE_1949_length_3013_cov_46_155804_g1255_i013642974